MRYHRNLGFPQAELPGIMAPYIGKLLWFLQHGYKPHPYQVLFHCNTDPVTELLARFRMEVAGRRGGKTLGAGWETVAYARNPELYWREYKGTESTDELHWWVVAADFTTGRPTMQTFRKVLKDAGLVKDKDYAENKTMKSFEINTTSGGVSLVEFRSAVDEDKLVGAGLHGMWWDEASKVHTDGPWQKARPTISDHVGLAMFTMTPEGKNWAWEQFFGDQFKNDPARGTVEFYSIDNSYFPVEEWADAKRDMHPMMFAQEYMASFDAMQGKDLHGEWLKFYDASDLPDDLVKFVGVDPSISQKRGADRFAISCVGISKSTGACFLLEQWAGRIPFPDQLVMVAEWYERHHPEMIGIEAVAYQAALAQQLQSVYTYLPIVPMFAPGKKEDRILGMSPLFKIGRVKIQKGHKDFISEWLDYDSSLTHPKDDCLDSVEITLRTAGALVPFQVSAPVEAVPTNPLAYYANKDLKRINKNRSYADEALGDQW